VADGFAERLRAAASLDQEPETEEIEPLSATPLQQLRELAAHASSETVRMQALRVLLEREDRLAEQRRVKHAVEDGPDLEYARWVAMLNEEQLDRELADLEAANADLFPRRDPDYEEEVERRVQQRLHELGMPITPVSRTSRVGSEHHPLH